MIRIICMFFLTDPFDRNEFEECCRPPIGSPPNKYCFNIDVPPNDEFFGRFGVRCIDFVRGFPGVRHGCRLGIIKFITFKRIGEEKKKLSNKDFFSLRQDFSLCQRFRSKGSRTQFNLLTATIDANTVYGVRESFARSETNFYFFYFPPSNFSFCFFPFYFPFWFI